MKIQAGKGVYEPSDDSFLMVDGLLKSIDIICKEGMLEVGVGSGYILLNLAGNCPKSFFIGTDINYHAALQTQINADNNGILVQVVCTEFARPFRRGGLPKICVFNPPYLPSDYSLDQFLDEDELVALVGGSKGTEVMMEFIGEMSSGSTAFFIVSSLATKLEELEKALNDFKFTVVEEKSFAFERLWLVMIE